MRAESLETTSREAWRLARRQHGVVARRQLLALGFTSKAIRHRLAVGRLHPVWTGVYAVGRPQINREGHWMAAVLACGPEAMLSHRSAAALWGFGEETPGVFDISVARHSSVRRPGIRFHNRAGLWNRDMTSRLGIPVTSPVKTFLDLATVSGPITI